MRKKEFLIRLIRLTGTAVNLIFTIAMLLLIGLGGYRIWDSYQVERSAVAANYAQYRPGEPDAGPSFEELCRINPEVVGWITVYGTNIDYPVLQAEDNWKYLSRDVFGEYSLTGSIYMDHANAADYSDFNTILYGHNMTPAVMFGNVKDFKDKAYFDTHLYGDLFFEGEHHGLELFSIIEADAYDEEIFTAGVRGREEQEAYLDRVQAEAIQIRDIDVTIEDHIALLSTCTPMETNRRDILIGRVTDETFENRFVDETGEPLHFNEADGQSIGKLLKSVPIAVWILILLPLILLIPIMLFRKKFREEDAGNEKDEDGKGP